MNVEEQLTHTIEAYKKRNQKVLDDEESVDLNDVSQDLDEFDKKLKVEKKNTTSQNRSRVLEESEESEDMETHKPIKADFKKSKPATKAAQAEPVAQKKAGQSSVLASKASQKPACRPPV